MRERIWGLIFCVLALTLTACEDKAEKRAKLQAQIQAAEVELNECTWGTHGSHSAYLEKCSDKEKKVVTLQSELDKLNGVQR